MMILLKNSKNKLFIKFYDVKNKKPILKCYYKNRVKLINSVLKSCHIPYLINGNPYFIDNRKEYIDGGMPLFLNQKIVNKKFYT